MPLPSPDCSSSSNIAPGRTFLTDAKVPANCKYISVNAYWAKRRKWTWLSSLSVKVNLLELARLRGFGVNGTVDEVAGREDGMPCWRYNEEEWILRYSNESTNTNLQETRTDAYPFGPAVLYYYVTMSSKCSRRDSWWCMGAVQELVVGLCEGRWWLKKSLSKEASLVAELPATPGFGNVELIHDAWVGNKDACMHIPLGATGYRSICCRNHTCNMSSTYIARDSKIAAN